MGFGKTCRATFAPQCGHWCFTKACTAKTAETDPSASQPTGACANLPCTGFRTPASPNGLAAPRRAVAVSAGPESPPCTAATTCEDSTSSELIAPAQGSEGTEEISTVPGTAKQSSLFETWEIQDPHNHQRRAQRSGPPVPFCVPISRTITLPTCSDSEAVGACLDHGLRSKRGSLASLALHATLRL